MKKKILIIAGWLLIWQLLALIVHNDILMVGPIETIRAFVEMAGTTFFWLSIWNSFKQIFTGFLLGSLVGMALGFAAYRRALIREMLSPFVTTIKAIPVASFVILLLIWAGNQRLSMLITMLVAFPIVYMNVLSGLNSTDSKLLEMAEVFHMPFGNRIRYIYLPTLIPFFRSALSLAYGMSWKSGVAAEVIGQPLRTIGNNLYMSKVNLETAELIAWTATVVLLSYMSEKFLAFLLKIIIRNGRIGGMRDL